MKIATSELEHLREEVKNCHCIIKDLQKKREFVGLTDEQIKEASLKAGMQEHYMGFHSGFICFAREVESKLKEKNT